MFFAFVESFDLKSWNGETARKERGVSGSHYSPMYLAEGLSLQGNHVDFISLNNNFIETNYMGVNYINYENYNNCQCDFIIISNNLNDLTILDKIKNYNKIIILLHNDLYCLNNRFFNMNKDKILLSYINNYSKIDIENFQPFLKDYSSFILPNSIDTNDLLSFDIQHKENSFVFFACIDRGFKMSCEVANRIQNFNIYSSTYYKPYQHLMDINKSLKNSSKSEVFRHLVKSKYFVYPLINLDNNCIHYDTFGYVILEALLHGVIVIAPKIKVYEELYGDAICYLDTDGIIPQDELLYWKKYNYNHNFGYPLLDKYVQKIIELENDSHLSMSFIEKGLNLKYTYCNKLISNNLLSILDNIKIKPKTILTVFAGREPNLNILKKYLDKAISMKLIDEVHFWNYSRNDNDEMYIRSISNLKRTSSIGAGRYIEIFPVKENNSFVLDIQASNDIHILIVDEIVYINYEIVIGGWSNQKNVVRRNGDIIFEQENISSATIDHVSSYKVAIENDILSVFHKNNLIINCPIQKDFFMNKLFVKTGHNSVGHIYFQPVKNANFFFMDTCKKKPWDDYYHYYLKYEYKEDIILKCDDDIVFIDLFKLGNFIEYIKKSDCDLVFANTINNGVSAYYQQNKYNLIPKNLMNLEYPPSGSRGNLWESHEKAQDLHKYFTENYDLFINNDFNNDTIPIYTRFSINFFGYKGKNWEKIYDCGINDEEYLTINYVKDRNFINVLYSNLIVSHLSFCSQNNMDHDLVRSWYNNLYDKIHT